MFKRKNEKHNIMYFQKKVSTLFTNGGLCTVDSNGFLIPGNATSVQHVGIIMRDVVATDADYATAIVYVPVDMCRPNDSFIADVSAGTVAQTLVGEYHDLDTTGAKVDASANSVKQVFVVGVLTAQSQVIVQVNGMAGVDETG